MDAMAPEAGASEGRRGKAGFWTVAIGASAGGLEAFEKLLRALPVDTGMAYVVVQHLAPDHPSILPDLIGRLTALPVRLIADGTQLAPDEVFVIPKNATLLVEDGVLRLAPVEPRPLRHPINSFFASLAVDQGENAVAIVLSGTGSDGSLGVAAVKRHGGITIAQAPEDARYDSMPVNAVATGDVDYVVPAAEIPRLLLEQARRRREAPQTPLRRDLEGKLDDVTLALRDVTGQDFTKYKRTTLVRRIQRRVEALGVSTVGAYVEAVRTRPGEAQLLAQDLMINVTQFFRDPEAWAALERDALPALVAGRDPGAPIRVWVPGCATGEEAYTLAMLLAEQVRGPDVRVQVFATDIDELALAAARRAQYPEWISAHVPPDRLRRFFVRSGNGWMVAKAIRDSVLFSPHDVARDPPFLRVDLVSCRNMLIYLERELQQRVMATLHYALRPEGVLFLGPSETPDTEPGLFVPQDRHHRIYVRRGATRAAPLGVRHPPLRPPAQPRAGTGIPDALERALLEELAPACAVADGEGQVRYFWRDAGRFLPSPSGEPTTNLLSLAHPDLRPYLSAALRTVQKERAPAHKRAVPMQEGGRVVLVDIHVRPLPPVRGEGDLVVVAFREVGERPAAPPEVGAAEGAAEIRTELLETRERLSATVAELQRANDELQTSNEELQLMNEEMQSSNEELQTSQEELQSLNEELNTVNAELNKKVEELDGLYGDLDNLFKSTRIASLFLDRGLRITRFTPAATSIFPLIEQDVGRPLTDLATRFEEAGAIADIRDALEHGRAHERTLRLADGRSWYLVRTLPYVTLGNTVNGVVVTFTDVSPLKAAEEALQEARERERERAGELQAILDVVPAAVWIARDTRSLVVSGNRAAQKLLRMPAGANASLSAPLGERPNHFRIRMDGVEPPVEELPVQRAAARGVEVRDVEQEVVFKDGDRLHLYGHAVPLRDESGQPRGAVGAFVDITGRRLAEEALRRADHAKDEFLAMLGHELRNPLAALQSAFEVMARGGGGDAAGRMRKVVVRQLHDLHRLVDDLLDVTRITRGLVEIRAVPVDAAELVRSATDAHRPLLEAAGLRLEVQLPDGACWIAADPPRIRQVLGNLLGNAAKFSEPGGAITVSLRHDLEGRQAVFEVRDEGIGIPAEALGIIFQPFRQGPQSLARTKGGLGLGLALVQGLVALHGGKVIARSDGPGTGATFEVRLPCTAPDVAAVAVEAGGDVGRPLRVLIVEDNRDFAEAMSELLAAQAGHEVRIEVDGAEGLRAIDAWAPDVVFCDIGLPGLDGYGVATSVGLRSTDRVRPILVAMSGYGRAEDRERSHLAGFDLHLTKPVSIETVLGLLARVARGERPDAGAAR